MPGCCPRATSTPWRTRGSASSSGRGSPRPPTTWPSTSTGTGTTSPTGRSSNRAGVPQDHGVEDQAECGELVLLSLAVRLADLAPAAMADRAGQPVAGLLHGQLPVHQPPVGVVNRVDDSEQVHGLVDPPVLGERGA